MAGLLVGSEGPAKMNGVAPGATVLPIRVAGWQPEAGGRWAVYGRTDQLIAGLERAVDPNLDGVALDAARIALVGVAEPFAAFEDSPSARAVAGALRLDTLVVAPAGNDGLAGPGLRKHLRARVAPARRSPSARPTSGTSSASVRVVARVGLGVLFDRARAARRRRRSGSDRRCRRALPRLGPAELTQGARRRALDEFFDERLEPRRGPRCARPCGHRPRLCGGAGREGGRLVVVLYGDALPGGGIGLDDGVTVPVVGVPSALGGRLADELAAGRQPLVSIGRASSEASPTRGGVAPFSSRGLAFDGFVKPDLVAPGVGLLTADPGKAEDGSARYSSISGTSAASADRRRLGGAARRRPGPTGRVRAQGPARRLGEAAPARDRSRRRERGCSTSARPRRGEVGRAADDDELRAGDRRSGWHATRGSSCAISRRGGSDRVRRRPSATKAAAARSCFAFAPSRVRIRPHGIATVYVARPRARADGRRRSRACSRSVREGATRSTFPGSITRAAAPQRAARSVRLSPREFRTSDTAPAVLSFQAGRIAAGGQVEPVALLELHLRGSDGATRHPGAAPRPPARALRLRPDRARRERRHARARQVPAHADRVSDRARAAEPRRRAVHHSVTRARPAYTRRRNDLVICSRNKE